MADTRVRLNPELEPPTAYVEVFEMPDGTVVDASHPAARDAVLISMAISLKRIADTLREISFNGVG